MRLFAFLLAVVVLAAASFYASGKLSPFMPPEVSFKHAGQSVDQYVSIDDAAMTLSVVPETDGLRADATLFLVGVAVQTVELENTEALFKPVLLSPGENEVIVRVRGHLGPFSWSRWHRLSVYAMARVDDLELNVPPIVWANNTRITGKAPPQKRVFVYVREVIEKPGEDSEAEPFETTTRVRSNGSGTFFMELDLPRPGRFEVWAEIDNQGAENAATDPSATDRKTVQFATHLPALRERALIIQLEQDGVRYQTRTVFERGDPRAEKMLQGELSSEAFQLAMQGHILIDGAVYGSEWSSPPAVFAKGDTIEVRSETRGIPERIFSDGSVRVSRWLRNAPEATLDKIEIQFRDREAHGFSPSPDSADAERVIWTNADGGLPDEITLKTNTSTVFKVVWTLSPVDLLPRWASQLFFVALSLIPLVWFLRILGPDPIEDQPKKKLREMVLTLGIFVAFASMSYLSNQLGDLLLALLAQLLALELYQLPEMIGGIRIIELAALLGFIMLFAVCSVLRAVLPKTGWWQTVRDMLLIVRRAIFWALLSNLMLSAVSRLRNMDGAVDYVATTLLWWVAFAICAFIGVWLTIKLKETAGKAAVWIFERPTSQIVIAALLVLVLIRPGEIDYDPLIDQLTRPTYDAVFILHRFVGVVGSFAPYLAAFLICAFLARSPSTLTDDDRMALALLLFAALLVGTGRVWAVVPVPFLLALAIFPGLVLQREARAEILNNHRADILAHRDRFLGREIENAQEFTAATSWFGLGLFGVRQDDQKKKRGYSPLKTTLSDGSKFTLPEVALTFGRRGDPLENGLAALRTGAWGALFFVIIYAIPSFTETRTGDNFPYLAAVQRVVSVGGYWLIAAFFFGYFFDRIRGSAGWKKGAVLAIGILLAREPLALLGASSFADYSAVAIQIVQTLVFFVLLGLITFDMEAFRDASGPNIDWRAFPLVTGLSVVEAVLSIVVATLGVAATTAFSGELTSVLGQVAAEIIQTPVTPPIPGRP